MRLRHTTLTKVTAGLATAAAVLTIQGAALAHEEPSEKPARELTDDPEQKGARLADEKTAELTDARLVAESEGWGLDETLEHLRRQGDFGDLVAKLADGYPDTYSGAVYADRPGAPSLIRFTGEPPADAVEAVKASGLDAEVRGGARASALALRDQAQKVHDHLRERAGYKEVVAAVDRDGAIQAIVAGGPDEPELPKELAEGVAVTLNREGGISTLEHALGGARVFGPQGSCTSGFTVRHNATGVTGVSTAGHCTGINTYVQPLDGLQFGLTHQAQHVGFWGDVEWKTSAHIEPAEYFANATQIRPVTSVEPTWSIVPGMTYCVYGRSSNDRECDQVLFPWVTNGSSSNLVAMSEDNTIPGDSGGPWSFNFEATGGHVGDIWFFGSRNVFSPAALWPIAIGVSVRTQ